MLGKLVNNRKRLLYVMGILVGAVMLMGAAMMLMSKISDGQALAESRATEVTASGDAMGIDASGNYAAALFSNKVEDPHDSAAVARLLTVMKMEEATGQYAVQIAEKDGIHVMTVTTELPVRKNDEVVFNSNMEKYAQQIMALIPQVEKVEWIYSLQAFDSGSGDEVQASGKMDDAVAAEALGKDLDSFGRSERAFGKLLAMQAE